MATRQQLNIWRTVRHGASVLGTVSLSVVATLAVQHYSVQFRDASGQLTNTFP